MSLSQVPQPAAPRHGLEERGAARAAEHRAAELEDAAHGTRVERDEIACDPRRQDRPTPWRAQRPASSRSEV
jgi:hypothetical protein